MQYANMNMRRLWRPGLLEIEWSLTCERVNFSTHRLQTDLSWLKVTSLCRRRPFSTFYCGEEPWSDPRQQFDHDSSHKLTGKNQKIPDATCGENIGSSHGSIPTGLRELAVRRISEGTYSETAENPKRCCQTDFRSKEVWSCFHPTQNHALAASQRAYWL